MELKETMMPYIGHQSRLCACSVLKPFDKCIICMQVNEAIFHTFERSWCQPRFVLFQNKTKIGNNK